MKNKNFLIVTDSFNPDTSSAAQLLKDLYIKLIQKKKKVLVVCARDNDNLSKIKKRRGIINVNCGLIKSKNLIIRGYNEFFLSNNLINKSFKEIIVMIRFKILYNFSNHFLLYISLINIK